MKRLVLFIATLFFMVGCAKAPITGRTQIIMLSPDQEMALGLQTEQEIFKQERISHDPKYTVPVERVGRRIAKATNIDLDWKFYVIDNDKIPNAFCLANGHVFVYTGLFKYIDNDAQLATVMAHEIAHAIAHHVAERLSVAQLTGLAATIANRAISQSGSEYAQLYQAAIGIGSQVGVMLPYSRMQESEADHIGLIIMAMACYDPREALKFWEKFAKAGKEPIVYLSTHPTSRSRIERLKELMPNAIKEYRKCHQKRSGNPL